MLPAIVSKLQWLFTHVCTYVHTGKRQGHFYRDVCDKRDLHVSVCQKIKQKTKCKIPNQYYFVSIQNLLCSLQGLPINPPSWDTFRPISHPSHPKHSLSSLSPSSSVIRKSNRLLIFWSPSCQSQPN